MKRDYLVIAEQAWPTNPSHMVTVELHTAGSSVVMPIRANQATSECNGTTQFTDPPEFGPGYTSTVVVPGSASRKLTRDMETGKMVLEQVNDEGVVRFEDISLDVGKRSCETFISELWPAPSKYCSTSCPLSLPMGACVELNQHFCLMTDSCSHGRAAGQCSHRDHAGNLGQAWVVATTTAQHNLI